jgi:dephospho-CoA kinase
MKTPTLITLVGMPGAGKSSCVDYLKSKGLPSVYFGGITLKEVQKRGLDITPENERLVREDLRKIHGNDIYAKLISEEIDELAKKGNGEIIVDGLYSWSEYKFFKQKYGDNAIVIAITAPRQIRHKRLAERPERPLTDEQTTSREYAEIENIEKGGPIANADYTINNQGDVGSLTKKIDNLLKEIISY